MKYDAFDAVRPRRYTPEAWQRRVEQAFLNKESAKEYARLAREAWANGGEARARERLALEIDHWLHHPLGCECLTTTSATT